MCKEVYPSATAVCEHLDSDPRCGQGFLPTPSAFRVPEKPDKPRIGRFHPTSGYVYGLNDSNTFERMKQDIHHSDREHNPYFPFTDREEWQLANFMYSRMTQGDIDDFLQLPWVSDLFLHLYNNIAFTGSFQKPQLSNRSGPTRTVRCDTQRSDLALHEDRNRRLHNERPRPFFLA